MLVLLVVFLLLGVVIGGGFLYRWLRRERVEQTRDRARLTVIEGQLATFRALLRLDVAEHVTRQQMIRHSREGR